MTHSDDLSAFADSIGTEWRPCVKLPITVHVREQRPGETHVSTREGITPAQPDDLIMRGVQGEEYPIGRELFEKTYRLGSADELAAPAVSETTGSAPEVDPIRAALERCMMSISGGLCFFTADAKHVQLLEARRDLEDLRAALAAQPPAPVPDTARAELAKPQPPADGEAEELVAVSERLPEGLFPVEYWDIDSGARIVSEPSEEGPGGRRCWVVLNSRTVNPCTEFSTVQAALDALHAHALPLPSGEVA